jgi:hypothetical protein
VHVAHVAEVPEALKIWRGIALASLMAKGFVLVQHVPIVQLTLILILLLCPQNPSFQKYSPSLCQLELIPMLPIC